MSGGWFCVCYTCTALVSFADFSRYGFGFDGRWRCASCAHAVKAYQEA